MASGPWSELENVFACLAGYEDINDTDRLCRDPVMRQLIGGPA